MSTGKAFRDALTAKQNEAFDLLTGDHKFTLLYGGGGSGKSYAIAGFMVLRALMTPNCLQLVARNTMKSLRDSLFKGTFPAVIRAINPALLNTEVPGHVKIRTEPMELVFDNGSRIVFYGLDDENSEKLFGVEFQTIFVNEISEIKSYGIIEKLIFRLRGKLNDARDRPLAHKFIMDCNPPKKSHWAYRRFITNVLDNGEPMKNKGNWKHLRMNPHDNLDVIGQEYIDTMVETLGHENVRRMVYGEFGDDTEGSLFPMEWIDAKRLHVPDDPIEREAFYEKLTSQFVRIVIAVDPAITNTKNSDLTGIAVCATDAQGLFYVLDDATMKGSPQQWANKVSALFDKWGATLVVAEDNQGGLMVEHTLRTAGYSNLPVRLIRAKIGKLPRAEPVSTFYEKGKVTHVGRFRELEMQMEGFTHDYNPTKQGSPDRVDALVHALTELGITKRIAPAKATVGRILG